MKKNANNLAVLHAIITGPDLPTVKSVVDAQKSSEIESFLMSNQLNVDVLNRFRLLPIPLRKASQSNGTLETRKHTGD